MNVKTITLGSVALGAVLGAILLTLGSGDPASAEDKRYYSIGTFHAGTTPYVYAGMLAGLLRRELPDIILTAEATGGTTENLDLIRRGETQFGIASPARLHAAYNGIGKYEGKQTDVRIMWQFMVQGSVMVTKADSDIKGFRDLGGKTVVVGPAGSSNEVKNSAILQAYGFHKKEGSVSEFSEVDVKRMSFPEAANALAEGAVDAVVMTQGNPDPSFAELAFRVPLRFVPVDEDMFDEVKAVYPALWPTVIIAGTYKGQDKDLRTLGDPNYVTVSGKNVPEEVAYRITKAYIEKVLPQMADQLAYTRGYSKDRSMVAKAFVVPPHPGAARYYKEAGIEVEEVGIK